MANYRAIKVVCEGVLKLLKDNFQIEDFNNIQFQFEVYQPKNFAQPMTAGVSLFLYQIYINHSHRTPARRKGPNGEMYKTTLPLDLHFLLSAWGNEPSLQHTIMGWLMRTLEDNPIIPASLLNAIDPGVFRTDETVEIVQTELNNEDFISIWRDIIQNKYQLSIPYMARNIWIESNQVLTTGTPVQRRTGVFNA